METPAPEAVRAPGLMAPPAARSNGELLEIAICHLSLTSAQALIKAHEEVRAISSGQVYEATEAVESCEVITEVDLAISWEVSPTLRSVG